MGHVYLTHLNSENFITDRITKKHKLKRNKTLQMKNKNVVKIIVFGKFISDALQLVDKVTDNSVKVLSNFSAKSLINTCLPPFSNLHSQKKKRHGKLT